MKNNFSFILILTVVLLVGLGGCKKAEFVEFKEPYDILLLDKAVVEIFSEPKRAKKSLGSFSGKHRLEATGISLGLDGYRFVQVKCPESIADCREGLGYIERGSIFFLDGYEYISNSDYEYKYNFVSDLSVKNNIITNSVSHAVEDRFTSETKGYLIKSDSIGNAKAIFNWFNNPSEKLPESISLKYIKSFIQSILNPEEKNKKVTELYIFFKSFQEPSKAKDLRLELIRKKYSALNELHSIYIEKGGEGWESSYLSKVSIEKNIVTSLDSMRMSLIREIEDGFPYRKDSWKGLASEFNSLSGILYVKESILNKALKDATYSISNAPYSQIGSTSGWQDWSIVIRPTEGVLLNEYQMKAGGKLSSLAVANAEGNSDSSELEIFDVNAFPEKNGLGFNIKMNVGEFVLIPEEIPQYFAAGGPGLKTLIANIPKNHKEILENYNFNKGLIYTGLAFGYGGFDKETGKMKYTIKTEIPNMYWKIFALIQRSPNNQPEGNEFKGSVGNYKWIQPKGKFIVKDEDHCYDRNCQPVEFTCFSEDVNTYFDILFSPSEINKQKPSVEFKIDSNIQACRNLISMIPEK